MPDAHDFSAIPSLVQEAGRYAWQDHCSRPLATSAPAADGAALLQAFSQSMPDWAEGLMRWRNRLVAPLGLKTGAIAVVGAAGNYQVGQRLGVFQVLHLGEQDAVLGENDRHLDFRLVLQWRPGRLQVSTLVRTHNLLGKAYLAAVTPFHHLMGAASMRRMVGALESRRAEREALF